MKAEAIELPQGGTVVQENNLGADGELECPPLLVRTRTISLSLSYSVFIHKQRIGSGMDRVCELGLRSWVDLGNSINLRVLC
jgi:hypothetical protein